MADHTQASLKDSASEDAKIQLPLAEDIVKTTRKVHARINKNITARLPLALPPHSEDAGPYVSGMIHFAPVYLTFEKLWQDLVRSAPSNAEEDGNVTLFDSSKANADDAGKDDHPALSKRMHDMLGSVILPPLARSERLKDDIKQITGWSDETLEEQFEIITKMGRLGDFISHIKRVIHHKPHVLLSYSYIMFMALFAGGRFIRASFENAGEDFWAAVPAPIKPTMKPCTRSSSPLTRKDVDHDGNETEVRHVPLTFWSFETADDGEALKRMYKERLLDWEDKLTAQERRDVIQESICIFENIGLVVGQLDEVWAEPKSSAQSDTSSIYSIASILKDSISARLRDSLAITRERSANRSSAHSKPVALQGQEADAEASSDEDTEDGEQGDENTGDRVMIPGIEKCPGIPKSMRFAKSLPIPPRGHPHIKTGGDLQTSSQRLGATAALRWVFAAATTLLLLGAFFSRSLGHMGITIG